MLLLSLLQVAVATFVLDSTGVESPAVPVPLSEAEILLLEARDQHSAYDFPGAITSFSSAMEHMGDSLKRALIKEEMSLSLNGQSMSEVCSTPSVVARRRFALSDFFLYYPLADDSWVSTPNPFDSVGGDFARAIYAPARASTIVYSAPDTAQVRCLLQTQWADTCWTAPDTLFRADAIYPMVCGQNLYFSAKGLYGVGGYDLYRSKLLPSGRWSNPENLGFPYSSPADDFLLMHTPDNRYTLFASNRDCPSDSVNVYVLEYDPMPVHSEVAGAEALGKLCTLEPRNNPKKVNNTSAMSAEDADSDMQRYMVAVRRVKAIRDSLSAASADIETVVALKKRLAEAGREQQAIEMEFLRKGVAIDHSKLEADSKKRIVGAGQGYTFSRSNPGKSIRTE